jgi:HemY protein
MTPLRMMSDLVAAESAHALRDQAAREHHLKMALSCAETQSATSTEYLDAARLCAARWSLGDRDADQALRLLSELPQGLGRRTLALRLRLKASRLVGQHELALETARLLSKHGAFSESASTSMLRSLALSSLSAARDTDQLQQLWQHLTAAETRNPEVARAAAQRWLQLQGPADQALQWVLPQWQDWLQKPDAWPEGPRLALVDVMEQALRALPADGAWLQRLEQAVQQWPQQAELLYLGGVVFMRHQLWGKAQQVFERSAARLPQKGLSRRAWCALAELAERREDQAAAAACWKSAALAERT